jgi:uncharacterized damage-inducible protein DinB
MEQKMSEDLSYPIGKFDSDFEVTPELRQKFINEVAELPKHLSEAVNEMTDDQLDTPYRPGGWSVRQTVHHVADSHLNAYVRFKLALTEDTPTIRPYHEAKWAELPDSKMPLENSFKIIEGVHSRWVNLLNSMSEEDFQKKLNHPESGLWELQKMLGLYAWHSKHHTAHITKLAEREGW